MVHHAEKPIKLIQIKAVTSCSTHKIDQFWSAVKPMKKIARFQVTSGTNGPPCKETHQAHTNQSSDFLQHSQNRPILECSEANEKNCKISGNLGDQWSTMQRNPLSSYKSKE